MNTTKPLSTVARELFAREWRRYEQETSATGESVCGLGGSCPSNVAWVLEDLVRVVEHDASGLWRP